jgi:hypothetical protein
MRPRATGGRGVRYALKIANAHHVSQACMLSPCARLVRVMCPTVLPRRYARRPRRTLRSHDHHQNFKKRGLGRKEAAAYAVHARTIINAHHVSQACMLSPCACLVRFMFPSSPSLYCPGTTRGGRGVRYARTIIIAHHVSYACMQPLCARLVRIISPTILPRPRRTLSSHDFHRASSKLSVHNFLKCGL